MKAEDVILANLAKVGISYDAVLEAARSNTTVPGTEHLRGDVILGCSRGLSQELKARCAERGWTVNDVLGHRPGSPEVRLRYDRGNGDLTAWLPSSRHLDYVGKGWVAVELQDEAEAHRLACAKT